MPSLSELLAKINLSAVSSPKKSWTFQKSRGMEQYLIKTLENPANGISKFLAIAGSDRRGASYGVFSVSEACGKKCRPN